MIPDDEEIPFAERLKRLNGEQYEKVLLGHAVRTMRRKVGMTQTELAKKLHTTQSVIARIEQGRQNVTLKTLVALAAVFGKKLNVHFG